MKAALAVALVAAVTGCKRARSVRDPDAALAGRIEPEERHGGARVAQPHPDAAARTVRIPDETRELVIASVPDWNATAATLTHWRRDGGAWSAVGAPWPAVIGGSGAAWGRGLHGDGAPDGRAGPVKREGDGRSPAGIFAIGPAFGYAAAAPDGARVPYTPVTATWRCVDDPASAHYNRVLDEAALAKAKDWSSAEDMRRADELYRWVVEVRHNPAAAPGGGSCIFFHVWSGPGSSTAGCTAMARPALEQLIAGLDPAARPVFVLLPAAELAALAPAWDLPAP